MLLHSAVFALYKTRNYNAALWCAEHNYPDPLYGVEEDYVLNKKQNNMTYKVAYPTNPPILSAVHEAKLETHMYFQI